MVGRPDRSESLAPLKKRMRSARVPRARKRTKQGGTGIKVPLKKGDLAAPARRETRRFRETRQGDLRISKHPLTNLGSFFYWFLFILFKHPLTEWSNSSGHYKPSPDYKHLANLPEDAFRDTSKWFLF
jgi:hypothetical protein